MARSDAGMFCVYIIYNPATMELISFRFLMPDKASEVVNHSSVPIHDLQHLYSRMIISARSPAILFLIDYGFLTC